MFEQIPNDELRLEDVPLPDADWSEFARFALTFNGYEICGSHKACAEIANERRDSNLTELRVCLFFEQRRYQHFGWPPSEEEMPYIRELIRKIRDHVQKDLEKMSAAIEEGCGPVNAD